MANRKTKNGENERLDFDNVEKVIKLLEAEKPITKKEACGLLNIAYNTTRLSSIIDKHKERKQRDLERRRAKRGTPATADEIKYIVQGYLEGRSIESISESIHRSAPWTRRLLDDHSVPIRARKHDYFKPELIPERATQEQFAIGQKVWCARYDSLGVIEDEVPHRDERVYRIWLLSEAWQQYCYQPASELASLKHLEEIGAL